MGAESRCRELLRIDCSARLGEIAGSLGVRNMLKKGSADRELLDVNDMEAEIAAVFQGEAINRHIRVETRFDRSLPVVMASKTQLQQVLLN